MKLRFYSISQLIVTSSKLFVVRKLESQYYTGILIISAMVLKAPAPHEFFVSMESAQ